MSIPNYATASGSSASFYSNGFLLYTLTSIINPVSNIPSGHAPRDNNPGDFLYTSTMTDIYSGVIGQDDSAFDAAVFDTRADGVGALETFIQNELNTNQNNTSETIQEFLNSYAQGATDNVQSAGFNLSGSLVDQLNSATKIASFEAAIIQGEGGNAPIDVQLFLQTGLNEPQAYITLNTVYDVNIVEAPIDSGTEIQLGNPFGTSIVNGEILEWSASNATNTIASNISQSYSDQIDPSLSPTEPTIQPPNFVLGTVDTDTFYNLGDGSTIIAGSLDYNLYITSEGSLWYGITHTEDEEIALPTGFVTNPGQGTLSGTMGASDLVIVNANNATYTGTVQGQIIVGAGSGDSLIANAPNETLIALTTGGGNYTFTNEGATGVTEIASPGMTDANDPPTNSVFSFGGGTNVLIGDMGNNTFEMAPSLTSGVNIIWGGGGTSKYDIYGNVDILYTNGTPTPQQIQSLASEIEDLTPQARTFAYGQSLPVGIPDYTFVGDITLDGPITFIVDPSKNDILQGISGTYSPIAGLNYNDPHPGSSPLFATPNESAVAEDSPEYGDVYFTSTVSSASQLYLYNFVNGDLGIDFTGTGVGGVGGGVIVDGSDPGTVYNYTQSSTIDIGPSNNSQSSSSGSTVSGTESILTGGDETSSIIASGGQQVVYTGGVTQNSIVENGAAEVVSGGGSALASTITSGGYELVLPGGFVDGSVILSGGTIIMAPGAIVGGLVADVGAVVEPPYFVTSNLRILSSSGVPIDGTIGIGEVGYVLSGGYASNSLVEESGILTVFSGGIGIGVTVAAQGVENIFFGGLSERGVISESGAVQDILSGGTAIQTNVLYGSNVVSVGGFDLDSVLDGGEEYVLSCGLASGTVISKYGQEYVEVGGTAFSIDIQSGGVAFISGLSSAGTVASGGTEIVYDEGVLSNNTLANDGLLIVESGGSVTNLTVESGGIAFAFQGANVNSANVLPGGYLVSAGVVVSQTNNLTYYASSAEDLTLNNDAIEYILSNGIATSNVLVYEKQIIYSGGSAVDTVLSGGYQLLSGGVAYSTVVEGGYEELADGIAVSTTILSDGDQLVSTNGTAFDSVDYGYQSLSGGGAYFGTFGSGGAGNVAAGGLFSGMTVSSGGQEDIDKGGSGVETTVLNGGKEIVSSGGSTISDFVSSGGLYLISTGGLVSNLNILSGATVIVFSGGQLDGFTLSSGGELIVFPGASIKGGNSSNTNQITTSGVIILSSNQVVTQGSVASNVQLTYPGGEAEYVLAGGTAINTSLLFTSQYVFSGGVAIHDIISASNVYISSGAYVSQSYVGFQGFQAVLNGGIESGSIIVSKVAYSPGIETVTSGGTSFGDSLVSGGSEIVSGGVAVDINLDFGFESVAGHGTISSSDVLSGSEIVGSSGIDSGSIFGSGGTQFLANGGTSYDVVFNGGFGAVSGGGTSISATIASGGIEVISSGGSSVSPVVSSGGVLLVLAGASLTSPIVLAGGKITSRGVLLSSASAGYSYFSTVSSGFVVSRGVQETVYSGTVVSGNTLLDGGTEIISSGAIGITNNVEYGNEIVYSGGVESGSIIYYGTEILSGGRGYYTVVSGFVEVVAGGMDLAPSVRDGGEIGISNSGAVLSASIQSRASVGIDAGGTASDSIITSDGWQVAWGGTEISAVVFSGGTESVWGGKDSGSLINNGGTELVEFTGGTALDAVIQSGGLQIIEYDGTAQSTSVGFGGTELVSSSGVDDGAIIRRGGVEVVKSSGLAQSASIQSGGTQVLLSGASASNVVVSGGGTEILSGGNLYNATVEAGGFVLVSSGAETSDSLILSGGAEVVYAGGTSSASNVDGGLLVILGSGSGDNVGAGGELLVTGQDVVVTPTGISAYNPSTPVTVTAGETEYVMAGATAVARQVINGGAQFVLADGNADGNLIGAGGSQTVSSGAVASGIVVSSGLQTVLAGGVTTGTVLSAGGSEMVQAGGVADGTVIDAVGDLIVSSGAMASAATLNGGTLNVLTGGQLTSLVVEAGSDVINTGDTPVTVENDANATITAAGNAIVPISFAQSQVGGSFEFINDTTLAQTVYWGSDGSVTVQGGAGGGYFTGGHGGDNLLSGGTGDVTLAGGAAGDTLIAGAGSGANGTFNQLYAGPGAETILGASGSGNNAFELGQYVTGDGYVTASGVASAAGSGTQSFNIGKTSAETLWGSNAAGAYNYYSIIGDSTTDGSNLTIANFSSANSTILLTNGSLNGPSDGTVTSITSVSGGALVSLSDGTQITLTGIAASSLYTQTLSNGIVKLETASSAAPVVTAGITDTFLANTTVGGVVVDSGGNLLIGSAAQVGAVSMYGGTATIDSGQTTVTMENDANATIFAAGNATVRVIFNQNSPGGTLDFINGSNATAVVNGGSRGSVTVFGGAAGGTFYGGSLGNNSLIGGTGTVELVGGGAGDTLEASSGNGINYLYSGSGNETLLASAASGEDVFQLASNSSGVVSTSGSGYQVYYLPNSDTSGVNTITGSSAAPYNIFDVLATATPGGASYVLQNFSTDSVIYLENANGSGPGYETINSITSAPGAANSALINLSDGTRITVAGVAASSLYTYTYSNGLTEIY